MDSPLILIIAVAVVAILIAVLLKRKQNGAAKADKSQGKGKKEATAKAADSASEEGTAEEGWDWGAASANVVDDTKVSVQDVDALTEFNVYKQFGYYDKAAESLAVYLDKTPKADPKLVKELVGLWLEAKNADSLNDALMQYQSVLTEEEVAEFIKGGLAIDEHHLGLRVLAESRLGWSVKKTAEEIGETTSIAAAPEVKTRESAKARKAQENALAADHQSARKSLVNGVGVIKDLSSDEKGAVLAFMQPEQSVKLLRDSLSYDAAVKYLNKAIRSSAKPAALLIDALTLDYRANNINGFAGHLWNLYYSLGQYGRQVKERMLGWGYNLGQHPMFERLEANPNEAVLREIGMQQGFIDGGSLKKGRYQPLVSEKVDVDAEPRTPAERILKESESLLMYGQLDASMELLEDSIKKYPQESQLYIALFDLYERAEEWDRLQDTVQELRSHVQTLPEEVVLAMSQLLQRFNNGSFGH